MVREMCRISLGTYVLGADAPLPLASPSNPCYIRACHCSSLLKSFLTLSGKKWKLPHALPVPGGGGSGTGRSPRGKRTETKNTGRVTAPRPHTTATTEGLYVLGRQDTCAAEPERFISLCNRESSDVTGIGNRVDRRRGESVYHFSTVPL